MSAFDPEQTFTRAVIAALALSLGVAPAFAFHHPRDTANIDEAMKTTPLSPNDKTGVTEYRLKGRQYGNPAEQRCFEMPWT